MLYITITILLFFIGTIWLSGIDSDNRYVFLPMVILIFAFIMAFIGGYVVGQNLERDIHKYRNISRNDTTTFTTKANVTIRNDSLFVNIEGTK